MLWSTYETDFYRKAVALIATDLTFPDAMKEICNNLSCKPPSWKRGVLLAAGVIGFVYAGWAIFWPELWFDWCHMRHGYNEMWMTVGMLNGVLAIGLLLSANNPTRYWPNVLVATIAKIGAALGFSWAAYRGVFPIQAGWVILLNDIIWIPPFLMILWSTLETYAGRQPHRERPYTLEEALEKYYVEEESLYELSKDQTLTIVFLRHFGCTFTRQLLRKLDSLKNEADQKGSQLVLVHMLQSGKEREYLTNDDVLRVADPYCELYRSFGLGKGGVLELFGPRVILQGVLALIKGCGVGHLAGDGLQLPGAFLVKNGEVVSAQRARDISELPKLEELFDQEG